jgi:predicted AAA+ superfamily ATPase
VTLLDEFMRYCLVNFSKYVSISKAYNYLRSMGLRCSKVTLLNFLACVQQVFFLFPAEIFSYSIKDRRRYPKKIYAVDVGLVNALYPEFRESAGRLMENLVAIELKRKGKELFYWKDRQGREVDFVLREGPKVEQLLQVTFASSSDEVEKRELRALLKASEELGCRELLCITWDYEDELEREGRVVKFTPLWKWLLG